MKYNSKMAVVSRYQSILLCLGGGGR